MTVIEGSQDQMAPCCLIYFLILWFTGFQCILGMYGRDRLRKKYNLPDEPCPDFFVHCCCHACGLCQEARYLKDKPKNVPYTDTVVYVYQTPVQQAPPRI